MKNRVRQHLEHGGMAGPEWARNAVEPPASHAWLHPASAPSVDADQVICPHCWEMNPGPFRMCTRCGADMRTILQESAGMRRTAAVQSPVPVGASSRLGLGQRVVLGLFVVMMALSYAVYLLPQRGPGPGGPAPAAAGP